MRVPGHDAFRCALTPLPAPARTVLADLGLALPLLIPFAVDVEATGWPAVLACGLVVAGTVLLGRQLPAVAVAMAAAAAGADWRFVPVLLAASYLAGRRLPDGRVALVVLPAVAVFGSAAALVLGVDGYGWLVRLGGLVVCGVLPWLTGRFRRQQVELAESGWDRAVRLERTQRLVAEQARLRERAWIAQDMHDSLGHRLSLAALQAGGFELAPDLPERHRATAAQLRAGITEATRQLRDITTVLRDETGPAPGTAPGESIADLVDRAAAAGLDVRLDGVVADPDPARDRVVHRTVQEALTNAVKHAPGAAVLVRVASTAGETSVVVTNGRPDRDPPPDRPSGGLGLAGLRARLREEGGTMTAGPRPDGGFEVRASLPAHGLPDAGPDSVAGEFREARYGVRRGLATAILVPLALGACLAVAMMGSYAYDTHNSKLAPRDFHALAPGQSRSAIAHVLPDHQVPERGLSPAPPAPAASTCEYYRSTAGFLPTAFDVYRLCFRDDHLVGKTVLPR